ncbi:hypothetical protein B0A55_10720, partial [Friedmanniomyces simplex]
MPRKRGRPVSIESDDPTIVRRREKTLERTRRYHARKRAARDEAIRSSQAQVEQIERVVTLPSIQEDEEAATTLLALAVRRPQGVDLDDDSAGSAPERSYEADEHGMGSPAQLSPIPSPTSLLLDDGGNIGSYSFTSGSAEEEGAPADLDSGVSYADNLRIDEGGGPGIEDSALGEEDSEPGNESHAFGHEDHETVDEIDPAGQHDDEPGALADDEESLMSFASER